jgi:hypothetical protein
MTLLTASAIVRINDRGIGTALGWLLGDEEGARPFGNAHRATPMPTAAAPPARTGRTGNGHRIWQRFRLTTLLVALLRAWLPVQHLLGPTW